MRLSVAATTSDDASAVPLQLTAMAPGDPAQAGCRGPSAAAAETAGGGFSGRYLRSGAGVRLAQLCAAGPAVAVATLGERGAIALQGARTVEARAPRVEAVDTTGAGDAFRAGWIVAVLAGEPLEGCLRIANAVAAMSCTGPGAQGRLPTYPELERFLAEVDLQGDAPRDGR